MNTVQKFECIEYIGYFRDPKGSMDLKSNSLLKYWAQLFEHWLALTQG